MNDDEITVLKAIFRDKLDDIDIKIYQILRENGRVSDTEIAKRIGVSITTVRRRRRRLQEKGYLQIIGLLLLRAANVVYADVLVKFNQRARVEDIKTFIDSAVANPRIYEVTEYLGGDHDVLVRFFEANYERLRYHIEKFIREFDVIERYDIYPAIGSPKAWYKSFKIRF